MSIYLGPDWRIPVNLYPEGIMRKVTYYSITLIFIVLDCPATDMTFRK